MGGMAALRRYERVHAPGTYKCVLIRKRMCADVAKVRISEEVILDYLGGPSV